MSAVTTVAFRDPLTGLYQRDLFAELAEHQLQAAQRDGHTLALLALDVDNMKIVNDRFGHAAGDAVLQAIAALLSRELRGADLSARFGGDEFVLLLPGLDVARAEEVARRLLREARQSAELQTWHALAAVTLSIGLAAYPAHGSCLSELLEAADAALLQAKAHGKNCLMTAVAPAHGERASAFEPVSTVPVASA